jgi:hypothetical protein
MASNEKQIWDFLKSKGLNDYGCAGLLGNIQAESALIPSNLENIGNTKLGMTDGQYVSAVDSGEYTNFVKDAFGFGICQWTWWSRKQALYEYAKSTNRSICDLTMQLEFLYKELSESYPAVLTTIKNATSVKEASDAVLLQFERPADQSIDAQNKRASYGQTYFDKYAEKGSNATMGVKTYQENDKVQLSKNFNSYEFRCGLGRTCPCSTILIDDKLVGYLQKIRDHFNAVVTITSAYRCPSYNSSVSKSTSSYHTKGMAADIVVTGVAPKAVAKYAESIGILGIGLYATDKDGHFVHIDTRSNKSFWYGQAQVARSTFGGANSSASSSSSNQPFRYEKGKTYKTQVDQLSVRTGAGTNYERKTYVQLSSNARKNATKSGYLKKGVSVTCLEVKFVGSDIWMRIPSGWCAAYYNGEYYIK